MNKNSNQLHYKYVYFNSNYLSKGKIDKNEYNSICLRDVENMDGVQVVASPLDYSYSMVRRIFRVMNRSHIPKFLKSLWYPYIFKEKLKEQKPYCFVVANTELSLDYLGYLKKKYVGCKLVKLHRDLVKISHLNPEYSEENMNRVFDLRMSYDPYEAKVLGMPHFDEVESKIDLEIDPDYPLCDVFFAGKAKDRFPKILKAYDLLTEAGLKCEFIVTHLPISEQVPREGITYTDAFIPYLDMLTKSVNAKCMLDINQEGAVGYTSRFLEAIIYNKKLIADNPAVLESKYYDPRYIQYVEKIEDIDPNFIKNDCEVDYHYEGDFSPVHLIYQIDHELSKMEEKTND